MWIFLTALLCIGVGILILKYIDGDFEKKPNNIEESVGNNRWRIVEYTYKGTTLYRLEKYRNFEWHYENTSSNVKDLEQLIQEIENPQSKIIKYL